MNPATTEPIKKRLRKQYVNNLNLEAKNNKKNYDANKILQVTGEEPIRPPDMRSVEEKEKDILNLKTLIRSNLMEITDGVNANQIVDELTNNELIFVANHMPYIIDELKPKFTLGIPAKIFLLYVRELIRTAEQPLNSEYGQSNQTPAPASGEESMDVDDDMFFGPSPPPPPPPAPPASRPSTRAPKRKTETEPETRPRKKRIISRTRTTAPPPSASASSYFSGPSTGPFSTPLPTPRPQRKRGRPARQSEEENPPPRKRRSTRQDPTPEQGPFSGEMPLPRAGTKRGRPVMIEPLTERPRKRQMVGRGLTKAPRISVDTDAKGVVKSKRYIPFGRYVINRHRLKNTDIMMIKTMKGGAIAHLPTVKISSTLSTILQQMTDGHMPSFDDIQNLSIDDKQQLHHITRKCDIDISVPNPDKDKLSQEMNRFDILKGEILAGNDNKEMVKEFKVMLLRFMNNGRIPRRQGQEILTDLASIGY